MKMTRKQFLASAVGAPIAAKAVPVTEAESPFIIARRYQIAAIARTFRVSAEDLYGRPGRIEPRGLLSGMVK